MIASYLLVVDTGPSGKQADEGSVGSFSSSCRNPKLSSVLWHCSAGCVGWKVVCHVGSVSLCHLLQQVNSAEAQSWCSFKWTGTGATFPGAAPRGALSAQELLVLCIFTIFQFSRSLLATRELHVTQRDLPSTAKAASEIPASLLFHSELLNPYHGGKNIPLSFLCLL